MNECIFCKVVSGETPARVVFENDAVIAFDDISPQAPVHTLVVPRGHHANLGDGLSANALGELFAAVPHVAAAKGVAESGYRVIVNNGSDAGQTVDHVHVHVLGGRRLAHAMVSYADE